MSHLGAVHTRDAISRAAESSGASCHAAIAASSARSSSSSTANISRSTASRGCPVNISSSVLSRTLDEAFIPSSGSVRTRVHKSDRAPGGMRMSWPGQGSRCLGRGRPACGELAAQQVHDGSGRPRHRSRCSTCSTCSRSPDVSCSKGTASGKRFWPPLDEPPLDAITYGGSVSSTSPAASPSSDRWPWNVQ